MLMIQEVGNEVNKKEILRFAIGGALILLLVIVSWQVFIAPDKVEALTKEDAQKIAQDRFKGNITNTALKNGIYIISFKLDTGEYDVQISKADGEIIDVIQTKEEERMYNLSENVIRQIIKQEVPGKIASFSKETKDKIDVYEAIVEKDDQQTRMKINGETGEVMQKEVIKSSETEEKKPVENEDSKQEPNTSSKEEKKQNGNLSLKDEQTNQEKIEKEEQKKAQKQAEKEAKKAKKEEEKRQKEEQKRKKVQEKAQKKEQQKQQSSRRITENEAIHIALKKVQGEVDDVDFEVENGQPYYYIEIETADDKEYELQIHAITGEIRSIEIDD